MSLLVFMYHRILPEEHPEAVALPLFQRQLDHLQKNFRMLTPAEVYAYIRNGDTTGGGPCAALTFDDGWVDNLLYATPVLRERGLSAMMAVSSGFLHDSCRIRESEEASLLRRSSAEAAEAAARGDFRNYLSRDELRFLLSTGAWSLEAHGRRHFKGERGKSILCAPQGASAEEFENALREDVLDCRRRLDALTGGTGRIFFWPYGHYSTRAAQIVRDCGYDLQFSVYKGACRPGDKRTVLPRIGVSRWGKFRKNCAVFRHPLLSAARGLFHSEKLCFDEFYGELK